MYPVLTHIFDFLPIKLIKPIICLFSIPGPMRQRVSNVATAGPYNRPQQQHATSVDSNNHFLNDLTAAGLIADNGSEDMNLVSMGHTLDEIYPMVSLASLNGCSAGSAAKTPGAAAGDGIPALPKKNSLTDLRFLSSVDQAFGDEDKRWGKILLPNKAEGGKAGFNVLSVALSVILDEHHKRMGINIPR